MNAPIPTGRILSDLSTAAPAPGSRGGTTPYRRGADIDDDVMRKLFEDGLDDDELAEHFAYCLPVIREHRLSIGLRRPRGRGEPGRTPSYATGKGSRHAEKPLAGKIARMPAYDHPALTEARTMYPTTRVAAAKTTNLLVSGHNSWKIGARVEKGSWKGFPIYTLTLEERATCPTSCGHWRSCFGNHMHMAKRVAHGAELERRLRFDVAVLARRHPVGFAIRLHVLGDFYSVGYVALWRQLIERYPNLHVFGFTARINPNDPITRSLHDLVVAHWPRAGLRFSNAPTPILSTVTIEHPLQKPACAIVCPAQLGQTRSCSTCALCWSTERPIAFLRH